MNVKLAYGKGGLDLSLPDGLDVDVVQPRHAEPLPSQARAVFAGGLDRAHEQGCAFVRQHPMAGVDERYDIVITGNSGHPLDMNLYQSVKEMSATAQNL